jgi:hypothetical protein
MTLNGVDSGLEVAHMEHFEVVGRKKETKIASDEISSDDGMATLPPLKLLKWPKSAENSQITETRCSP